MIYQSGDHDRVIDFTWILICGWGKDPVAFGHDKGRNISKDIGTKTRLKLYVHVQPE